MKQFDENNDGGYGLDADGNSVYDILKQVPREVIDEVAEQTDTSVLDDLEPGKYVDLAGGIAVWIKNEDGTWADHEGISKPKAWNFILVNSGMNGKTLTRVDDDYVDPRDQ